MDEHKNVGMIRIFMNKIDSICASTTEKERLLIRQEISYSGEDFKNTKSIEEKWWASLMLAVNKSKVSDDEYYIHLYSNNHAFFNTAVNESKGMLWCKNICISFIYFLTNSKLYQFKNKHQKLTSIKSLSSLTDLVWITHRILPTPSGIGNSFWLQLPFWFEHDYQNIIVRK